MSKPDLPEDKKSLQDKILLLETELKHLKNELKVTKSEYEDTARNYYDIYSNMEKKVQEQTELLLNVFDNIPALVYWKDKNLVYLGCNRNQALAFGIGDPDLIVGKTDFEVFHDRTEAEAYRETDKKIIESGISQFHKIEMRLSENEEKWMDCTRVPLHDQHGEIIGMIGIYEDITEKVKKEREQEIIEDQMQQAQKLQSLGVLAGGIAHDFNNILTPIIGYAGMAITEVGDNPDMSHYLDQITKGATRAKELVKQILTFSRQGEQELKPLDIKLIVKEALKLIRSIIPATISMNQKIENSTSMVFADPTQMHQIILNLCTNASHAMRENGGALEVILRNTELTAADSFISEDIKPGKYVELAVKDSGQGISPEILEKIFDPFFTTKKTGEGTGMGLSVVHGIVNSLDGYITVKSFPSEGTEFHIFIPSYEGPAELSSGAEKVHGAPAGDGEHIMVVDDEEIIVDMLKGILNSLGYQTTGVSDSIKALDIFKENPDIFDLVITDQTMPGTTGSKLASELKIIRPSIPIILCSGYSDAIASEYMKDHVIDKFLTKPLTMLEIASSIRELLEADKA